MLRACHRHGELGAIETQILTRGLDLGDLVVGDVMRPLAELVWIGLDTTIDDVLTEVRSSRYTRYPVRDPATHRFVGLLHIKELLTRSERLRDIRDLRPYLRTLPHVDEHQQLESALVAFRRGDPHFAIVTGTLKALGESGGFDEAFLRDHTSGFEAVRAQAAAAEWPSLERGSGAPRGEMQRFARLYREASSAIFVWSMGITQHAEGVDNVQAILNLALARGMVGRAKTGLLPIRGHSGVQGGIMADDGV